MNPAAVEHGEKSVRHENREVRKLGELASFRTGPFGSALHKSDYIIDGVPVINPMHIVDGRLVPTPDMTVTDSAARSLQDFRLAAGDVVIGRRGDMGRCALVRQQHAGWLCGTGSMIVRPQRGLESAYCQLVLSSPTVVAAIENSSVGSTMINLNQRTLAGLCIDLPSPAEQRAIAATLSDTDELIDGLGALITKKRDLKQAAMQQLLTGRQRLPGFRQQWSTRMVAQIAEVKTGPFGSTLHERDYVEDGTPIITVEHLGEFGVTRQNLPMVSASDRARLRAYSLRAGDIVFSRVGSVDRNALIREAEDGWLFSGRLLRVRPNRRLVDPAYLSYQFHGEEFKCAVATVAVGQTMASLNTAILNNLPVEVPLLAEQSAIAAVLGQIDSEICVLEARLHKALALKQAMMQQLLTGRIRLT